MPSEATTVAVAIRDEPMAVMLSNAQLQMIANTSFVPAAYRGKVPEVLACVATGRALGLPDMTSLRGINNIDGKSSFSAELMDAIVRSHGHSITGTVDETKAVVRGKRVDNGDEMEATFTMEMAEKAGLLGKQNWKKHPDDMMWARAVSKLCRRLFADCFAGATYVPEEMEATADEVMDEEPPSTLDATVANLQSSGGLTEPGVSKADNGGHTPSVAPPEGVAAPGSVSSLDMLIATYGRDTVVTVYKELFQGRGGEPLTDEEAERLANELAAQR